MLERKSTVLKRNMIWEQILNNFLLTVWDLEETLFQWKKQWHKDQNSHMVFPTHVKHERPTIITKPQKWLNLKLCLKTQLSNAYFKVRNRNIFI